MQEQGFPPAELAPFKILISDDGCFHAPRLSPKPDTSHTILEFYGRNVCTRFSAATSIASSAVEFRVGLTPP